MSLRTVVGVVKVLVWHGLDPADKHWGCPIRVAAQVAGKWGCAVDDSVIHGLVQRVGSQAQAQTQQRLKQPARESEPGRRDSELALLMLDGWFARFRGLGGGRSEPRNTR